MPLSLFLPFLPFLYPKFTMQILPLTLQNWNLNFLHAILIPVNWIQFPLKALNKATLVFRRKKFLLRNQLLD